MHPKRHVPSKEARYSRPVELDASFFAPKGPKDDLFKHLEM